MPHLVISISGHGYGHVAQTAPILNALHRLMPQLRMSIRSAAPLSHLCSRIVAPFEHLHSEGDIGMLMSSALDVQVDESRSAYRAFHADWDERVATEAALLKTLKADYVFSNAGYLPLAGAQKAGIGNAALCSLNWYDIYAHYCAGNDSDDAILAQIHRAYAGADAFLRATPGMQMSSLANVFPVAPIADIGRNRRDELDALLGLTHDTRLVLLSMGGIATRLPMEDWPRIAGVRYLVQASWRCTHPDAIALESLPMSFSDLLSSSDLLLSKPGYGSFVEARYSGVPVLYVNRGDWPESAALKAWLEQHGNCQEISREQAAQGHLDSEMSALWSAPRPAPSVAPGALQVATWLAGKLANLA